MGFILTTFQVGIIGAILVSMAVAGYFVIRELDDLKKYMNQDADRVRDLDKARQNTIILLVLGLVVGLHVLIRIYVDKNSTPSS